MQEREGQNGDSARRRQTANPPATPATSQSEGAMINTSTAVLAVADVTQTADYYVNVLGFKQHWLWGTPPTFGCVGLGKAEIFLGLNPDLARHIEGHQHCFGVDDVESLHE